jgi:hypothetical protein
MVNHTTPEIRKRGNDVEYLIVSPSPPSKEINSKDHGDTSC